MIGTWISMMMTCYGYRAVLMSVKRNRGILDIHHASRIWCTPGTCSALYIYPHYVHIDLNRET